MTHTTQHLDLLIVLITATAIALIFERLKLQAILGFLLAGAIIGPHSLGILSNIDRIHDLAEIGMIFLMLTIGLEFSFERLQGLKKIALLGGTAQITVSIGLSIIFSALMGWTAYQGFVLGSVIALSSTAVVFRNLLDRAELDTQHGRLSVAILVFQDLAVGPLLILMTSFGSPSQGIFQAITLSLLKAGLLLGGVLVIAKYILPKLMRWIALSRSREIFLLSTVLLCFGTSWISSQLGLSAALGAFFAGIMLANTDYHYQISGEITPFRHIFVSIFFISIGLLFDFGFLALHWNIIFPLVGLILIVNCFVIAAIALAFGYPPRVAIITGVILSQIGEFSFLLLETAKNAALIDTYFYQTILSAAVLTIFMTPFLFNLVPSLMRISGKLPWFGIVPHKNQAKEKENLQALNKHIILCGYGTAGQDLAAALTLENIPFVVIEMNPQNIGRARRHQVPVIYGDALNEAVLKEVAIEKASAIVISFGDSSSIAEIVRAVRRLNSEVLVVVRTRYERDVAWMYELGADMVIMEELEVSVELTRGILNHLQINPETLKTHLDRIRARKEFIVEQNILKRIN